MGRHHSSKSFQQACCLHQANLSTSSYQRAGLHLLRFTVINLTYFEKNSPPSSVDLASPFLPFILFHSAEKSVPLLVVSKGD